MVWGLSVSRWRGSIVSYALILCLEGGMRFASTVGGGGGGSSKT